MRVVIWLGLTLYGCKGDGDTDPVEVDCTPCDEAGELCVLHADESGTTDDYALCAPLPDECGESLDCGDNTCVRDAYALCESGYEGASCAAEESPALICYAAVP